jgi:hypothetical protein
MAENEYYGSGNPFLDYTDILEVEPQSAYYSSPSGTAFMGQSPGTRRYYQNQFQNIYNEYLGAQGDLIRGGALPSLKWADYLDNVPFTQRYAALTPEMAGRSTRRYSPGTRQIYF